MNKVDIILIRCQCGKVKKHGQWIIPNLKIIQAMHELYNIEYWDIPCSQRCKEKPP